MFDDDPFKNTVESKAEKPKTRTKEKPLSKDVEITTETDESGLLSTTIRYGASYDAPMDNLKTRSAAETDAFLSSDEFKQHVNLIFGIWQGLRKKAEELGLEGGETPAKPSGGANKTAGSRGGGKRPNPPGTPEIECEHGVRNYFGKNGWEALFCPAEEKSEQCPPLFKQKNGKFEENNR